MNYINEIPAPLYNLLYIFLEYDKAKVEKLINRYKEQHRGYHTLEHINTMFNDMYNRNKDYHQLLIKNNKDEIIDLLESENIIKDSCSDKLYPTHYESFNKVFNLIIDEIKYGNDNCNNRFFYEFIVLSFAIFFHDIVYNPESKDNEYHSIIIAVGFFNHLQLKFIHDKKANIIHRISNDVTALIESTEKNYDSMLWLKAIMQELDYKIFSSDKEELFEYEKGIKKEYYKGNYEEYKKGRIQFLEELKDKIYLEQNRNVLYANINWLIELVYNSYEYFEYDDEEKKNPKVYYKLMPNENC